MEGSNKYIVLNRGEYPLSKIYNDCGSFGSIGHSGENLQKIIKNISERIQKQDQLISSATTKSINWNQISSKPEFSSVAISGNYNDLLNKPTLSSNSKYNQILIGERNGENREFSTPTPFFEKTTRVYVRGLRQTLDVDYEEINSTTIKFNFDIDSTDNLIIDYN